MPVSIEKLRRAVDQRGQVFEPLDLRGLSEQRNVHVVLTEPGHIRGNHFHHVGSEVSAVLGPALVRYRDGAEITTVEVPSDEVWRFRFPPGVVHAFQNIGSSPMLIVSFNTMAHDPQNADTSREVIL